MKKTKPAAKSAKKLTISARTKTVNQAKRKKAKVSTAKRYAARAERRETWKKANPGMNPGEIGKQAHPKPLETKHEEPVDQAEAATDAQVVEAVAAAPFETQAIEVADAVKVEDKVTVKVKLTAFAVTDQIGDRFDTSRDGLTPADEGFNKPVDAKDVE